MPHQYDAQDKRAPVALSVMGGSAFGGGPIHLLCLALGYLFHDWVESGDQLHRVAELAAGRVAQSCVDSCSVDCEITQEHHNHFGWEVKLVITGSLLSIPLWVWLVLRCIRGSPTVTTGYPTTWSAESTPSSRDDRRHLAQLQIAEIRARGRRHGAGQ